MDQVITFDKSLQQRLEEYKDVLSGYEILPVSAIEKEWGFYLELTVDPNGWQAVWKIQRRTCEALDIPFPSVVLVFVLSLDFKELTAFVKILAVQDDIHIPDKHHVPLMHLWPTRNQDKSIYLSLQSTANALDMLRFFYNNVFMPWDYEEEDNVDWKTNHLESRLRLYYDMKNGVIPRSPAEHLQSLITEAKRLQVKKEELQSELADSDDLQEDNTDNSKIQALMDLHIRMMEIKAEVDILENPILRDALIRKYKQMSLNCDEMQQNVWVIMSEGTATSCIQFLSKIEEGQPNQVLKFSPQLASTLECANGNDTFILNESVHNIKTTGVLEYGGTLKGVSPENTTLTSETKDVMLDFRGDKVVVENITIDAVNPQCAIIVRRGHLIMKNCKVIGDGKSSTHQGIIVLGGAKLEIFNCEVSKFCTAIVGNPESSIGIENSEIFDCNLGLKLFDNCYLSGINATIRNCKDYGICLETDSVDGSEPEVGDFDCLKKIPKLQLQSIKGNNNVKGDAVIGHKSRLIPVENLFEDPNLDPTICIDSDEEMDTQNITVIEKDIEQSPASV